MPTEHLAERVRQRVIELTNERTLQKRQQDQEYALWARTQSVIAKQLASHATSNKSSEIFQYS